MKKGIQKATVEYLRTPESAINYEILRLYFPHNSFETELSGSFEHPYNFYSASQYLYFGKALIVFFLL